MAHNKSPIQSADMNHSTPHLSPVAAPQERAPSPAPVAASGNAPTPAAPQAAPIAAQATPTPPIHRPIETPTPQRQTAKPRQHTKRLPAGPARAKPSLSGKKPSIGGLIYALDAKPSTKPYTTATIFSAVWFFIGGLLGWVAVGNRIGQFDAIADVALTPAIFIIAACILIPIAMAWMLATLAVRAQEMKLMASAMTEVAIRLAEPDKMAEQKVASMGQTIRRQISSMDDAISQSIDRAGELETIVHREVASLERSYDRNENMIKGLISELASERTSLLKHGKEVAEAIGQVGQLVDQKLIKSSSHVAQSLAKKSAEAAHKLHEANAVVTSKLESINQQVTDNIPEMMDKLVSEQARMDKVVQSAHHSLKDLHGNLANQTNLLAKQSTILTNQSDTLKEKTDELGKSLAEQTTKIDAVLTNHSTKLNKSLTQRVLALDASLGQRTKAIDQTMEKRSQALDSVLEQKAGKIDKSLEQRSKVLDTVLEEKANKMDKSLDQRSKVLDAVLEQKVHRIDQTLEKRSKELDSVFEEKASQMDKSLDQRSKVLDAVLEQKANKIDSSINEQTRKLYTAMDSKSAEMDATLSKKTADMDMALGQKAKALDSAISEKVRVMDHAIEQRMSEMNQKLATTTKNMNNSISDHVTSLDQSLSEKAVAMDAAFSQKARALDASLENKARNIDTSLTKRIAEIDSSLSHQAEALSASLGMQTNKMKQTLDDHSSSIESSLQAQTHLLDKTLSMNNQSILETSNRLNMSSIATKAAQEREQAAEKERKQAEALRQKQEFQAQKHREQAEKQRQEAEAFQKQQEQIALKQKQEADRRQQEADIREREQKQQLEKQRMAEQQAEQLQQSSSELLHKIRSLTQDFESQGIALLDEAKTLEASIATGNDNNADQNLRQLTAKTDELDYTKTVFTQKMQEALQKTQKHADSAKQSYVMDHTMTGQQKLQEVSKLQETAQEQTERAVAKLQDNLILVTKQVNLSVENANNFQKQIASASSSSSSSSSSNGSFYGLSPTKDSSSKKKKSSQWSMGDLLSSSINKDPDTPTYKPASSSQGASQGSVQMDPLDVLRIDEIARAIDAPTATDAWLRYQNGEKNVFTRNLYNADGQLTFDRIQGRYQTDMTFRDTVERYVQDYEGLLSEAEQTDPSGETTSKYLMTETGRVYLMLAHISGRLG